MEDTRLAYIAGIIDGEGYVGFIRAKSVKPRKSGMVTYTFAVLTVSVSMTEKAVPELLYTQFGGVLSSRGPTNKSHKDYWQWRLQGPRAAKFLSLIKPYLMVKHRQAEVGVMFQEARKPSGLRTQLDNDYDRLLVEAAGGLNRRGKAQPKPE